MNFLNKALDSLDSAAKDSLKVNRLSPCILGKGRLESLQSLLPELRVIGGTSCGLVTGRGPRIRQGAYCRAEVVEGAARSEAERRLTWALIHLRGALPLSVSLSRLSRAAAAVAAAVQAEEEDRLIEEKLQQRRLEREKVTAHTLPAFPWLGLCSPCPGVALSSLTTSCNSCTSCGTYDLRYSANARRPIAPPLDDMTSRAAGAAATWRGGVSGRRRRVWLRRAQRALKARQMRAAAVHPCPLRPPPPPRLPLQTPQAQQAPALTSPQSQPRAPAAAAPRRRPGAAGARSLRMGAKQGELARRPRVGGLPARQEEEGSELRGAWWRMRRTREMQAGTRERN